MAKYLASFLFLVFSGLVFASEEAYVKSTNLQSLTPDPQGLDQIAIPRILNYQGKLTTTAGAPVRDSIYSVTFRLFTVSAGGTDFWNETQLVQTRAGLFSCLLGSTNPIPYIPSGGDCYLEMQVNPNPPMSPRVRIVSSAYSYLSRKADSANYAASAPITRPITPPISGGEIAKPCSLYASTTAPILYLRNDGNGNGLFIKTALIGSTVDSAKTGSTAYYARYADFNGVGIDYAKADGVALVSVGRDGLGIWNRAGRHGVFINSAGFNGIRIRRTDSTAIIIDSAGQYHGVWVKKSPGTSSFLAGYPCWNGVWVDSAQQAGFAVAYGSQTWGIYAKGNGVGGEFFAGTAGAEGIIAHAYNNVSTDTAIYAYGKGIATGGWAFELEDGKSAPCIASPDLTIIAYGTARLVNGKAEITYPEIFANNIRTDVPVRISLTPKGEPTGLLYTSETKSNGFTVALKRIPSWGENTDITFDWVAFGTLKEPKTSEAAKANWENITGKNAPKPVNPVMPTAPRSEPTKTTEENLTTGVKK